MRAALSAGGGPVLGLQLALWNLAPLDGLHHLADHAVGQHQHGVAILVGDVKRLLHHIHGLLNVGGGQHHRAVVAVAAAAGGLKIVALAGLDSAKARSAAHAVDNDGGQLCARKISNALLLQRDTGGGGGGHGPHSGARCPIHHVDGGHLGLRLNKYLAVLRHVQREIFRNLALRGDGITEEAVAAGADRRLCNGFIAFPQFLFHENSTSFIRTFQL
ncbi:hypothetical protein SDC9_88469 [bioreactor metagenome]|uniref:Uncharacterized protein n=1 Tax=bioreactor metagenome TaxID=1076179 RepID=A0A644ZLP2_9ZZZZ